MCYLFWLVTINGMTTDRSYLPDSLRDVFELIANETTFLNEAWDQFKALYAHSESK